MGTLLKNRLAWRRLPYYLIPFRKAEYYYLHWLSDSWGPYSDPSVCHGLSWTNTQLASWRLNSRVWRTAARSSERKRSKSHRFAVLSFDDRLPSVTARGFLMGLATMLHSLPWLPKIQWSGASRYKCFISIVYILPVARVVPLLNYSLCARLCYVL